MSRKSRIMLVDDEENVLHSLRRTLSKIKEWEIVTCSSPYEAIEIANTTHFDLFISDYRMPGMDGVEFLISTMRHNSNAMRLILSGATDFEGLVDAINKAEIYRFLNKPVNAYELIATVTQALQLHDLTEENLELAEQVRKQQNELDRRESALKKLAEQHPLITDVNWGEDGSILLNEEDIS